MHPYGRMEGKMTNDTHKTEKASLMNAHVSPLTSSTPNGQLPPLDARDLISDGTTRQIDLDGQIYTLRITRAGKLILTK